MTTSPIPVAPLEWTPELVRQFWDLFASSPLTFMSFSRQVRDKLVEHVQSIVPPKSRILDFGAGDGDLAEGLLENGFSVGVYEQSSGRTGAAHTRLAGHPNFLGSISPESVLVFDAVCAFEVLEHILADEIDDVLRIIARFLDADGIFFGSVPNNENLLTRQCICPQCGIMFHRWQHVRSFDEDSLKVFLQKGSFRDIQIKLASFSNSLAFSATADRRK